MIQQILPVVLGWVSQQGYALLFVALLIEGPAVTAAGAFASTLGVLNPWAVFALSILGNLIPDAIYYWLGYWGREKFVDKYGRYLHITPERIRKLEHMYHEHAGKTLLAVKLLPVAATPGLIIAGVARVPIKKYAWWSIVVTIPSSVAYFLIGYYAGAAYTKIEHYINYGQYALLAIVILFIIFVYLNRKVSGWFSKNIQEI